MKNRIFYLFWVLVLCMCTFFMPAKAYAKETIDTTPPVVSAELVGERLHIEAEDKDSGVDAVFVGGRRVNYRVDGAVDLTFRDYAKDTEEVRIWAVDFAGNESEAVKITNPYYEGGELSAAISTDSDEGSMAFTPDGQATVLDNATNEDGKEFYVFTTPEDNIFYLVIDKQRDSDNVYFLNAVTEDDLALLAEKGSKGKEEVSAVPEPAVCHCTQRCEAGFVNTSCLVCKNELRGCLGKEAEPVKEQEEKDGGAAVIFIFFMALAAGGAGYYFKVYKPRHDLDDAEDLDDLLGEEDGEELDEDEVDRDKDGYFDGFDTENTGASLYDLSYGYGLEDEPEGEE